MNTKKKKIKEVILPMEFNPLLNKFEPVLPTREEKRIFLKKRRINWWAIAYIAISVILTIISLLLIFLGN